MFSYLSPSNSRSVAPLLSSVCMSLFVFSAGVHADVWKYWGEASMEVGHDDNVRLRSADDAANTLDGGININATRFSDKFDLEFVAGGNYENYFDADDRNMLITGFKPRIDVLGTYRIDERQEFSAEIGYRDEQVNSTVATTELDETDIGFSNEIVERERRNIGAEYKRSHSEKLDIAVASYYVEQEYDVASSLSDSEQMGVKFDSSFMLSEKNRFVTEWGYLDFQSDLAEIKRYTVLMGVAHKWSEVTSVRFTAGYTYQDGETYEQLMVDKPREWVSTSKGDFETKLVINHRGERSRLNFSAAHVQKPSISGKFIESDRLTFIAGYGVSERIGADLAFRYFENSSDQADSADDNRKYFSISPSLSWSINDKFSAYVRYEFRSQDRVELGQQEESNAFVIGIKFKSLKEI